MPVFFRKTRGTPCTNINGTHMHQVQLWQSEVKGTTGENLALSSASCLGESRLSNFYHLHFKMTTSQIFTRVTTLGLCSAHSWHVTCSYLNIFIGFLDLVVGSGWGVAACISHSM